jgi:hypothetical protein
MPLTDQPFAEMRTKKTGASCYQYSLLHYMPPPTCGILTVTRYKIARRKLVNRHPAFLIQRRWS